MKLLLLSLGIATDIVLASRYFSGSFSPYPACDSQYNAPCSTANTFKAVQQAVSDLGSLSTAADVEAWLYSLNQSQYDNGVDGSGFGPMVVSETGEILADPENPTLAGASLSDLLLLQNDNCNQTELQETDCARVTMTLFQEDLLSQWTTAAASDGWTYWVWTSSVSESDQQGTVVPEKRVGFVQNVSTQLGNLLVLSSYSDQPLASQFADDTTCSSKYDELCSVELSRMLVGSGLTSMMMASTRGDLTRVFWDITFSDTYTAGAGFYIFVYRFGSEGSPGERGECVAHGANSGHVGQNLPEILLKVNVPVNGTALHDSFSSAAEEGGGWVAYEWRNDATQPVGFKIAFIAGTEKFGTKYYLGVGFDHEHAAVAPGPQCSDCSSLYSYICAIRNTYVLMGHVQAFLLTDVEESLAWSQLTTSFRDDEALVRISGTVEEAGYKFGGVGDGAAFYSFVYDFNGTNVAHASNGAFVGRTLWGILAFVGINTGCDSDDLNCNVTLVDGAQLNEDFKSAASGGGGWAKYSWRNKIENPATEKVAYIVKISKYGREFYAGVGYNNVIWDEFPGSGDCSADFASTCSEDSVLAIVGHMTAAINNAQSSADLEAIFSEATTGTGDEYRRPGNFTVAVYDESAECVASGGSPAHVGMTLEDIFLELGSKLLSADQYVTAYQDASSGSFFYYNWQTASMDTPLVLMAFAQKATYKPLGSYGSATSYYVVSSFVDASAPPRCNRSAPECPESAECDEDSGYCQCKAGFIASFIPSGSCGVADGCTCDTWDYNMTCEVNPCPPGQFGTTSGECQDCDPGKFSGSAESSECSACDPGKFQDAYGKTSCLECDPGTSINAGGSTACESCMEGWFQDDPGSSACEKCPYGKFSSSTSSVACADCPVDHETTVDRAAISQWECVCEDGWFRGAGHLEGENGSYQQCNECKEGMECAQGNEAPVLLEGFWTSAEDADDREYSVFRCRSPLECPGGEAGTCAAGREGVGCANCMSNMQPDRSSGECTHCTTTSVLPIVAICLLLIMGFVGMALYARVDTSRIKLNTLAVGICMGQTAVAVQALAVFKVLEVDWVEPIESFLKLVSVLSFDLDLLGISCLFPDSNVIAKYVVKALVFPIGIAILCAILAVMNSCFKQTITMDHVVNSIGLLFLVLFLTLAMLSLTPFYCASSPNGTMSLVSNPSVICYDTSQWTALAVIGALCILFYVVLFCTWTTWVTLRYPKMITSGQGMMVLNRYRFLFQRFTVECYWFTPVYLVRNFTITILPVIFADYGHRQVFMLASVFMFFGFTQCWLKPWRGFLPNLLDIITTFCLVMALVGAALLDDADYASVVTDMQVFFSVLIGIMSAAFLGFGSVMVWRRFFPPKLYAAFLCHHKLGCAVGARLMKMELETHLHKSVFLDSDELNNLEDLLEIVRTSIGCLVVLLTAKTLSRPWCAGEIATAFKNGVPIVPVSYDDYTELTEEEVQEDSIILRWPPDAFVPCVTQGVSMSAVAEAYDFLRLAEKIPCPRVAACMAGNPEAALEAVNRVVATLKSLGRRQSLLTLAEPEHFVARRPSEDFIVNTNGFEGSMSPMQMMAQPSTGSGMGSALAAIRRRSSSSQRSCDVGAALTTGSAMGVLDFAVLANYADGESISAARVLSRLVRAKTQWQTAELLHPYEVQQVRAKHNQTLGCLCVLLTSGCLASEGFPKALAEAFEAWSDPSPNILTVNMTGFEFPTSQVLKDSIIPQVAAVLSRSEEEVAKMYNRVLSVLAIPFSPHDHITILEVEVDGILRRIRSEQKRSENQSRSGKSQRTPGDEDSNCSGDEPTTI